MGSFPPKIFKGIALTSKNYGTIKFRRKNSQIFSKTRIDTDTSSRHSEDLFTSREITTEISTKVNIGCHALGLIVCS